MKTLILLLVLIPAALHAQSYTVSSGALPSYPVLTGATNLALADDDLSAPISPAGFNFYYFGAWYDSFQVGTNGYIVLGGAGVTTATAPDHATAPGLCIAPLWVNLGFPFGGTSWVRWRYLQGVLQVEWNNMAQVGGPVGSMPPPSCDMVLALDTVSGVIDFQYGFTGASATGPTSGLPNTVAISGPSGAGQEVIPGYDPGHINANGSMGDWPLLRWVRFTPVAGVPVPGSPLISVSANGAPVANGATLNVLHQQTLASLNLQISVSDPDGDPTALTGTVSYVTVESILNSEFSCPSAGVPYTLVPTSGRFDSASASLPVTLTATDGISPPAQFSFLIQVGPVLVGGAGMGGGGGAGGCAGGGGSVPLALLLPVLIAAVSLRRRVIRN
ncbi:MAG: hypothetical protein H6841_06700 [Planctomycetes bacterium]|nr:hypothetical protein [Planctomycetota bacterium]MCB9936466.1 hypothetical protein [Planctomycetota bacterium]